MFYARPFGILPRLHLELCCAQGFLHVPGGLLANQQRAEQRHQQRDAIINTNGDAAAPLLCF